MAVLFDDPGVTTPGKPYTPQSVCNPDVPSSGGAGRWQSRTSGTTYDVEYMRVTDDAVTVTWLSPVDGTTVEVTPHDGWAMTVVPDIPEPGGTYGIHSTNADGVTTTYVQPSLVPDDGVFRG